MASPDVDADGDGWTPAQGDCCDSPLAGCPQPELVNPGAFDIRDNHADDDCDGIADNAPANCDTALASNDADAASFAQAIDVCQFTTETPALEQRRWGVISAQFLLPDGTTFPAAGAPAHSIRQSFGANVPQSGSSLAILSTGHAAAPGQTNPSYSTFEWTDNGTQSNFPADWFAANGNQLPNAPGCPSPAGSSASDPIMLKLRLRVPTNVHSFSVSTRFFTAEFAEWVCSPYNDFYVVLLDSTFSGSPANPADKNLAVYTDGSDAKYPIGVNLAVGNTGLFNTCVNGTIGCQSGLDGTISTCTGIDGLIDTGFDALSPGNCNSDSRLGGGTSWLTTTGNVVPGETIELRFALWDTSDHAFDSLALLDNFQWSTDPTIPGSYISGSVPRPDVPPSPPTGVSAKADGTAITVSWNPAASATSYRIFRRGASDLSFGEVGSTAGTTFQETASAAAAYLYRVRASNGAGTSLESTADLATTVNFSDDPLATGTPIRAAHVGELRSAVAAVRNLVNLSAPAFTDAAAAGVIVKAVHVNELRTALDEALTQLGLPAGHYTDSIGNGVAVKKAHFQELRDRTN